MNYGIRLATFNRETSPQTGLDHPGPTLLPTAERNRPTRTDTPVRTPWRRPPTLEYLRALRDADIAVRKAVRRRIVLQHTARLHPTPTTTTA
jgi:hypothetical protein